MKHDSPVNELAKSLGKDVMACIEKHVTDVRLAPSACWTLISICCGLAYEYFGDEEGKKQLLEMVEELDEYSKDQKLRRKQ